MNTSADAPYLDCAYKLQEYAGRARRKRSEGKATWPGPKQIHRRRHPSGIWSGDVLSLAEEPSTGEPLLRPQMRAGRRIAAAPSLEAIRARIRQQLSDLPAALRDLDGGAAYPVSISDGLRALADRFDRTEGPLQDGPAPLP